jgi:hypothetical protein
MIQPGDIIEARLLDAETQSAVTQTFAVTDVRGTAYLGGQFEVDTAAGWHVRLSRKDVANLNLPTTLSEIYIIDRSNVARLAIGKNETWRDERGALVDLADVFSWSPIPTDE